MNNLFFLIAFSILIPFQSYSQDNNDYVWILGYLPNDLEKRFGGTYLDFNMNSTEISFFNIELDMSLANGAICDESGNLRFYTNGCKVVNFQNQIMAGGDSLNTPFTGIPQSDNCTYNSAYGTRPGLTILPIPDHPDEYIIFHLRFDGLPPYPYGFYNPQTLLYTIVDMTAENGLGRVKQKNVFLQKDTFCDMLATVRHGNGRDWWLAVSKTGSDKVFLYLLTPQGIEVPLERRVPLVWGGQSSNFAVGQALFSPDGTRFARIDTENGVHLYCFDRCSGEFSCPVQFGFPGDTLFAAGISFSPNSRFMYASTGRKMYQFDCSAKDVQKSKILLGVYDGFKAPFPTTFYQQQLAPDGKIYMSCTNGAYYLHVVHNPNVNGVACNFEQHGMELPTHNGFTLPNYPNFRLYDWANSPCDTLAVDSLQVTVSYFEKSLKIFPNPSNKMATIVPPDCVWGSLRVYNAAGVLMQEIFNISSGQTYTLETGYWPAGVYFVSVLTRTDGAVTKRLLVRH